MPYALCPMPPFFFVENDPVFSWREQMLDTFDGEARQAIAYSC